MWLTRRELPTGHETVMTKLCLVLSFSVLCENSSFQVVSCPQAAILQTEFGSRLGAEAKADGFISHSTGRYCLFNITVRFRMISASYSTEALAVNFPKWIGNT